MKRVHDMPFGARLLPGAGARFRLWAPGATHVDWVSRDDSPSEPLPMHRRPGGWFEIDVPHAGAHTRYAYRTGGMTVPDPASRHNPQDVHGASVVTDPCAYDWQDAHWRGRPWHEAVIYELHVGCFTEAGTFTAAIDRLDDLVALGITAVELMPVAEFAGRRGWGYDGVLLYAPEASYGTPDELKAFVAAAHERNLMVLLDVVYNHFGPDGNYLHVYAPHFFNPDVPTPWGAAINFDRDGSRTVRDFFIHNALYWIEEFHFDGLRVDAVHAMHDLSTTHFVDELALAVRAGPGRDRHVHLVLENDHNDAAHLAREPEPHLPPERGGTVASIPPRLADAQWNDDAHHALHVLVTGESDGYYVDYAELPLMMFGRALAEGFIYQGERSGYRQGEARGTPSTHLPPLAFVNSMQTHDQVGNRAHGERIGMLAADQVREDALRAVTACVLLAPSPPMLFMGEEFAASTPFLYFCDFEGELAQAVTHGRRGEFARFAMFSDPAQRQRIADPNATSTFQRSKLRWAERSTPGHAPWLALYTHLLGLRRRHLAPLLPRVRSGSAQVLGRGLLAVRWPLLDALEGREAGALHLRANLCDREIRGLAPRGLAPLAIEPVYDSHAHAGDAEAPPWSVRVWIQEP